MTNYGPVWNAIGDFQTLIAGVLAIVAAGLTAWALWYQANLQRNIAREKEDQRRKATINALLAEASMIEQVCGKFRESHAVRWEHKPRRVMGFIVPIPDLLQVYFREGLTLDQPAASVVAALVVQLHQIAEHIRTMSEDTMFDHDGWELSCAILADAFEQARKTAAAVIAELEALKARQARSRGAQSGGART